MSLILEALRKSEAERQIGRAPGLLTPMPMSAVQPSSRRWWLASLLVGLVVVAVTLAWWVGRSGQSAATQANPGIATNAGASAPPQLTGVATTATDEQTPPAPAASVATPTPVTRSLPAAGPADFPSDPDFESTERESLPLPAPISAPPLGTAAPGSAAPVTATPVVVGETAAAPTPLVPSEPVLPAVAPTATALPVVAASTPLSALSAAERAGLPPLRLSMHVFNAEPSRRFVMIDSHRHAEGDALTAEIKLVEIRREGAVVDIRGRLVLIERP